MFIAPSILAADILNLENDIIAVQQAGANRLHLDIMDGHFVPNLSFGPHLVKACAQKITLPLDVHLMIAPVDKLLQSFIDTKPASITFHAEADDNPLNLLKTIQKTGIKAGLALNPDIPAETLAPFIEHLDLVLIMSVYPGFGGQSFIENVVPKITEVRKMLDKHNPKASIQVDGGVSLENKDTILKAGADTLVVGTALFKHDASEYAQQIAAFKK